MRMMVNFSGAFWTTFRGFQSSEAFEELLSQENVTLSEVLDDDEVIQECKNQNPKLID